MTVFRSMICILLLPLTACALIEDQMVEREIEDAISKYNASAGQIGLGDPKEKVLSILGPAEHGLRGALRRPPEAVTTDQGTVEIYYFRTAWVRDGKSTDDEFTPYVFRNGRLASIGWQALGGPKTIGTQ